MPPTGFSDSVNHPANLFGNPGVSVFGSGLRGPGSGAGITHHLTPVLTPQTSASPLEWNVILDQLPYGLLVLGPGQEVRHENATCRKLLGFGVAEKGGVEAWLTAVCPEKEHREKVINSWREHIWRNQLTRTFTLKTAAQKLREIEFRSSLLRDGGITLTLEDVTETRRTEETLRHGKLKFRVLFSHSETGTVLVDRTGRIIDANPAFIGMTGIPLKDLRLSSLAELLHPNDASELAEAGGKAAEAAPEPPGDDSLSREVWLRTSTFEKRTRLTYCPITDGSGPPSMAIYLFSLLDSAAESTIERLSARLRSVSARAQALLLAVPDLILLLDAEGRIADYAPPPKPWAELNPDDSWRRKPAGTVWPIFGNLLQQFRAQVSDEGKTIHADICETEREGVAFSVTLSPCGDGQILAVIRKQTRPSLPAKSDLAASPLLPAATNERRQHGFRNQLQLLTSIFSLEPQGSAARDAFLRWQIRLRSMAQACPYDNTSLVWIFPLLRNLADEICSLVGRGPGRREIIINGSEDLTLDVQIATPFSLLVGELMRLILATRQPGPGPEMYVTLRPHVEGGLQLAIRPGTQRNFVFTDRETEIEILELLTEQIQGRLEVADQENPGREWVLIVPSWVR